MVVLIFGVLIVATLAAIIIPLSLKYGSPSLLNNLPIVKNGLLVFAAVCSGLLSLICLAAAAWGMNIRLPLGLGILMYLIPALSFPAFVILKFSSVRALSHVLWLMTLASSLAFYFGDQAERLASGLHPITSATERIGLFADAFTIVLAGIAVVVQIASLCASREKRVLESNFVPVD